MENITAFYKKIIEYDQNENWGYKFLQHMMEIFFVLPTMLNMSGEPPSVQARFIFITMLFMGFAIHARLAPFTIIKEEGQNQLLSQKLKYIPISKKQLFKKKWQVLWRYILKLTMISFGINLIISLCFFRHLTLWNGVPIMMGLYGIMIGYWMIKK